MNSKNAGDTANGGYIVFSVLSGDDNLVYLKGRKNKTVYCVNEKDIKYGKAFLTEKYCKLFDITKIIDS